MTTVPALTHRASLWVAAIALALGIVAPDAAAQQQTVGLFVNGGQAGEGFVMLGPTNSNSVYLLNSDGHVVHEWTTDFDPILLGNGRPMAYLLDNGDLLRSTVISGSDPRVRQFDWNGNVVWEYDQDDAVLRMHHDLEPLPNGNVLMIAREYKTATEAIQAGLDPAKVDIERYTDVIIEVQPTPPFGGVIVWEWHAWDHLVQNFDPARDHFGMVEDHPELININFGETLAIDHPDWTHVNAVDYNAELDQIVVTVRHFSELWIIDHSTTTAEAAGHTGGDAGMGGDLLYRWGNAEAYGRGLPTNKVLYGPHDAQWIRAGSPGAGNLIVFNNGRNRPAAFSAIEEIAPPVLPDGTYALPESGAFGPMNTVWTYTASPPTDFFSSILSGVERLPNGNTLVCEGLSGRLFEIAPDGTTAWDYVNPLNAFGSTRQGDPPPPTNGVFKTRRYPVTHPGLVGRDLTPSDPLELFSAPFPVADGALDTVKLAADGSSLQLIWDVSTCPSADYSLLYGNLADVSTSALSGAHCDLGNSGSFAWTSVPSGSSYYLIVGVDETGLYESTWGDASPGEPRNGTSASFTCGVTNKIVSTTCP